MNKLMEVIKNNKGIIKKVALAAVVVGGLNLIASTLKKTDDPDEETYEVEMTEEGSDGEPTE